MQEKNTAMLVGAIISGVITFFCGIIGLVCTILGVSFTANPEHVNVEVNGRVLEGAEAAEAALKAGKVLSTVGGICLVIALIMLVIAIVLGVLYGKKKRA